MKNYDFFARKICLTIIQTKSCRSKETISLVLFGSKSKKIILNQLNELPSYGSFLSEDIDYQEILLLIDELVVKEIIHENTIYNTTFLSLSYAGIMFLINESQGLNIKELSKIEHIESDLENNLKNFRKQISKEREVSPFIIFDNKVLKLIVEKKPRTKEEFIKIKGLGPMKWEQFGQQVLEICKVQ